MGGADLNFLAQWSFAGAKAQPPAVRFTIALGHSGTTQE
jgi:hypothetical protein